MRRDRARWLALGAAAGAFATWCWVVWLDWVDVHR